jgi:hypothetical protein
LVSRHLELPMLKRALALGVLSCGLGAAMQFIFVGKQTFQTYWPASMQFTVAGSNTAKTGNKASSSAHFTSHFSTKQ